MMLMPASSSWLVPRGARLSIRSAAATPLFQIPREPTAASRPAAKSQAKQPPVLRPNAAPSSPLSQGEALMKIGKHQGRTFAEVYAEDSRYCRWACKAALTQGSSSDHMKTFAAYVQHRWLLAIHDLLKQAQPDSLKGQRLVVTGEPEELSRSIIEDLIRLLGGQVLTSSKASTATGIVAAGPKLWNGDPVNQSAKMQQAAAENIPVVSLGDFHALVGAASKGSEDKMEPTAQSEEAKAKGKSKAKAAKARGNLPVPPVPLK